MDPDIKELWKEFWRIREFASMKQVNEELEFDLEAHVMCFQTFMLQAEQAHKSGSRSEEDLKNAKKHLHRINSIVKSHPELEGKHKFNLVRNSKRKEKFLRLSFSGVYAEEGYWIDKFDKVHKIEDMSDDYKNNVIDLLIDLSKDSDFVDVIEINGTRYSYGKEYYAIMSKIKEFKDSLVRGDN
nr:hypothetical protein [uncultured bacterium]